MANWWTASFLLLVALAQPAAAASTPREVFATSICTLAESEARAHNLDTSFFVRLLWRESLFDPNVVSNKGAQGIAQFMPGTATRRGVKDPFDPFEAVKASATYLADLKTQFGNLGLAAASYNAGEQRISDWLAGKSSLPSETRGYVSFITGHDVDDWKDSKADLGIPAIGADPSFLVNCTALAMRKQKLEDTHLPSAPASPWGALLAVNFSEAKAVAQFRRLKLRFPVELANRDPLIVHKRNLSRGTRRLTYVMLGEATQAAAAKTCASLNRLNAPCIVRKN